MSPADACLISAALDRWDFLVLWRQHARNRRFMSEMWTLKRYNGAVVAVSLASQKAHKEKQNENTCLEMCRYQSVGVTEASRTTLTALRVFH